MPKRPEKQTTQNIRALFFQGGWVGLGARVMLGSVRPYARKWKGESFDCVDGATIGAVNAFIPTYCVAVLNIEGSIVLKLRI